MGRVPKIGEPDPRRITPAAGATADDAWQIPNPARGDEPAFVRHRVDGVDNRVKTPGEQTLGAVFGEKFNPWLDLAVGVNRADTLRKHLRLETSYVTVECRQLPVHVAEADLVEVDQGEGSDAGSREGLDHPRTHAAEADHRYPGSAQTRESVPAVKPGDAREPGVKIVCHALIESRPARRVRSALDEGRLPSRVPRLVSNAECLPPVDLPEF